MNMMVYVYIWVEYLHCEQDVC